MKVYKIIDRETGLFSKGGSSHNPWSKTGKSWSNIGHVKSHLNMHNKDSQRYPYKNADVVEIEVKYEECYKYPVDNLMDEIQLKKEEQQRAWKEQREKWIIEKEMKQLEELKNKYDKK